MTRSGPIKTVDGDAWRARYAAARAFRWGAESLETLLEEGQDGTPVLLLIVHCAIAYGDALSMRYGGIKNQQDHKGLVQAIKSAMKHQADDKALEQLQTILAGKTDVAYGTKIGRRDTVDRMMKSLHRFIEWADAKLKS